MENDADTKEIYGMADYLLNSRKTNRLRYYFIEGPIMDIGLSRGWIIVAHGSEKRKKVLFYGTKSHVGNYNPNENILRRLQEIYKTKFSEFCGVGLAG